MTVAAAVLPVDGFTGVPITDGSAAVIAEPGRKMLRKQDGCRIFWDNGETVIDLTVGGGIYLEERLALDIGLLKKKRLPCRAVYLFPSWNYPFPPGTGWEAAETTGDKTGTDGLVPWNASKNVVRLARNCLPGDQFLFLKTVGKLFLEDRILFAGYPGKQGLTRIMPGERTDLRDGGYALAKAPDFPLLAGETEIYLSYRGYVTTDGEILVPCCL